MLDNLVTLFIENPSVWLGFMVVFSLLVGSFLNVVIHRLPIMLEREWGCECRELLADELNKTGTENLKQAQDPSIAKYNLVLPNSTCPQCHSAIKPWQNIPIISWLLLRGKCANCKNPISARYPLVELLTGLAGGFAAWHFGFGLAGIAAIIFTFVLIALTFIDLDKMLLPDQLTLPLLWLGLLVNINGTFVSLDSAVIGAILGYLSLWSVFWLFKLITGKEGMGYGDFKLLAAFGAWMGYQALLPIILISSFVGAILGIIILKIQNEGQSKPIPFGPYLAIAGWIAFYWRDDLIHYYLTHFV